MGWAFCLSIIRYALIDWFALFFFQRVSHSNTISGLVSFFFPFVGGLASFLFGRIIDHLTPLVRHSLMFFFEFIGIFELVLFVFVNNLDYTPNSPLLFIPIILYGILGFTIMAPLGQINYLVVECSTPELSASTMGFVDAVSTIGAIFSGIIGGQFIDSTISGWDKYFIFLSMASFGGCVFSIFFIFLIIFKKKSKNQNISN